MRKLMLLAAAAALSYVPVTFTVSDAQARVGRPLTPFSVAGVHRRHMRRAYGVGWRAGGVPPAAAFPGCGYGYNCYSPGYAGGWGAPGYGGWGSGFGVQPGLGWGGPGLGTWGSGFGFGGGPGFGGWGSGFGVRPGIGVGAPGFGWHRGWDRWHHRGWGW